MATGSPVAIRPATRSYIHVGHQEVAWHYGVFDCTRGNPRVCVTSFCCPCVQHGRNVSHVEQDPRHSVLACTLWVLCFACPCVYAGPVRHRMRARYALANSEGDTWTACCCPCCSVAQVAHELAVRGEPLCPRVFIVHGAPAGVVME